MNLKKEGFYAKLWVWFYQDTLPKSLCAFFWSFWIAFFLAIPIYIWRIPVLLGNKYEVRKTRKYNEKILNTPDYNWNKQSPSLVEGFWRQFWISLVLWGCLILSLLAIRLIGLGIYDIIQGNYTGTNAVNFYAMIVVMFVILGVISLAFGSKYISQAFNKLTPVKMTKEYSKAFFQNYCPKINWQ